MLLAAVSRCSELRILKTDLFEYLVGERDQVDRASPSALAVLRLMKSSN